MTLDRTDFPEFFAALHPGATPFAWQTALLNALLDERRWPEALVAPTGAGKTAAIDVHVFAVAVAAATATPLPPRRLAMIVNRRVLVDDQYQHAQRLASVLARPDDSEILDAVAAALWQLHSDVGTQPGTEPGSDRSPLLVARLRGGMPPPRQWADHPTAAAVLCATPDMFGSRLLFRGYGSAMRAWPRAAGLLAVDTAAVVDEAHLARQLVRTARRVAHLLPVAERPWSGPPALQVVETTATPASDTTDSIGVDDRDLADSAVLHARLRRPKPVTLVPVAGWATHKLRRAVTRELAQQTADLHARTGGTVGCFVNTVATALAVATALRDTKGADRDLVVVLICGQVRPYDLELLQQRYPGLLSAEGNPEVDVLVSTQSLEVGVDLDLAGMVTELAGSSALAQRAGRVNRRGLRDEGPLVVVTPTKPPRGDTRSGPYDTDELRAAFDWITRRAAEPDGLAPWALRTDPPPPLPWKLRQRPELGQVWHWARTDALAADPELDLWLTDDLTEAPTVGLVVRDNLPDDDTDAITLIKLLPPRPHETFPVPLTTARNALHGAAERAAPPALRTLVVRGTDVHTLEWTGNGEQPRIRPGDVVVVDAAVPLFIASHDGEHRTPPVVATDDLPPHPADDVLEGPATLPRDLQPGEIVHRIDLNTHDEETDNDDGRDPDEQDNDEQDNDERDKLVELLAPNGSDEPAPREERGIVADWLESYDSTPIAPVALTLLRAELTTTDVVVLRDQDGAATQVVIIDGRKASADEYVRQEWSPSDTPVLLADHQQAVADRVTTIAELLGLPAEHTRALHAAALHHDDGKADRRFQTRLGRRATDGLLAKSREGLTPETVRRRFDRSGLPPGWRHEQRSVLDAWHEIPADVDRELAARLIGTTHGHGRTCFPHGAAELLAEDTDADTKTLAAVLFDEGRWDELIEATHHRYGVWGCAYLEAVLRAADGQISAEGR